MKFIWGQYNNEAMRLNIIKLRKINFVTYIHEYICRILVLWYPRIIKYYSRVEKTFIRYIRIRHWFYFQVIQRSWMVSRYFLELNSFSKNRSCRIVSSFRSKCNFANQNYYMHLVRNYETSKHSNGQENALNERICVLHFF